MAVLWMFIYPVQANVQVKADKSTAYYSAGEAMEFIIESDSDTPIEYWISYGKFGDTLTIGEIIDHSPGSISTIEFTLEEPGFVLCTVQQSFEIDKAAAAFSPHDIQPSLEKPDDFQSFWENEIDKSNDIPLDPILTFEEEDEFTMTYRINLAHIDDRRIYGFITLPKSDPPFPASLMLPAFGSGANVVQADRFTAERAGMIAVAITIHNAPPGEEDPNAYEPNDMTDRDNNYHRYAIVGAIRMIDYLHTRDDFDGENICVIGNSQGGGLSLLVGGIDNRVNLMLQSIPTMCGHSEFMFGKPIGFPYYLNLSNVTDGSPEHLEQTLNASNYYDGIYASENFKGASLNFVAYEDETTPPSTGFAAFNQLPGPKIMFQSPIAEHSNPTEWSNDRYDFFRRHFEATQTPPWPYTDNTNGYYIDAGNNFDAIANEPFPISGSYDKNGVSDPDWNVHWDFVSGPGSASFSNADTIQTQVTFSEPGDYKLRLIITDPYPQDDEIFIQMVDYVDVIVIGNLDSTEDNFGITSPLLISPNPANQFVNIKLTWENYELSSVRIIDQLGKVVQEQWELGSEIDSNVDLSKLNSGIYFLEIDNGTHKVRDRLVITR